MVQTICDCCKKPMRIPYVTITVTKPYVSLCDIGEWEHHLCKGCASQIKEKFIGITVFPNIVDIDDETLFRYKQEVSALADELGKELLRREP